MTCEPRSEVSLTVRKGPSPMMMLHEADRAPSPTELAGKTGPDRVTARRLLRTLLVIGIVVARRRRSEMGVGITRLARGFSDGRRIAWAIQPIPRKASEKSGGCLSVSPRDVAEVTCLAQARPMGNSPSDMIATGTQVPPVPAAAGQAVIAHLPPGTVAASGIEAPATSATALRAVRRTGLDSGSGPSVEGVASLAVSMSRAGRTIDGTEPIVFPLHRYDVRTLLYGMPDPMRQRAADIGATR